MTQQTPEQIEADIARQRADLADTVSELQTRIRRRTPGRGMVLGVAAGTVAAIVGLVALNRRHGNH